MRTHTWQPDNAEIASVLDRVADLLEAQGANAYRVRAYRTAARTVRQSAQSMANLWAAEGLEGLERLWGVGASIASTIQELVDTGRLRLLERLEGQVSPEDLFTTVPGIGEELARRIHVLLDIDTLEELELAAHDGRLEEIAGFGRRRSLAVREALASMLGRSSRRRARWIRGHATIVEPDAERPRVAQLLAVDAEYRARAGRGELRTIAPRRFNPDRLAWLPILHAELEGWAVTALFSNTARAHELGKTHDWVVLYYERDGHEGQSTVVTELHGPLAAQRVVRGREAECVAHYASVIRPGR